MKKALKRVDKKRVIKRRLRNAEIQVLAPISGIGSHGWIQISQAPAANEK